MLHATRGILLTLATTLAAGCGGSDEPDAPAQAPDAAPPAAQAAPAPAEAAPSPAKGGDLTLADAARVGFVRGEDKAFRLVDAVDGAAGTMGGGKVEIYAYAGSVPAEQEKQLRDMAIPEFGWKGFCRVRNLTMVYENEAACRALRGLD